MSYAAKYVIQIFVLSVVLTVPLVSASSQQNDFQSLSPLVKELSPSVVNISTTSVSERRNPRGNNPFGERGNDPFDEFFEKFFGDSPQSQQRRKGLGSGVIFSEDGYIITNNHVIEKAADITVILENGDNYKAEVIGTDPKTDLALLKIEPKYRLPAVRFGNSDRLDIGDWVLAIGNPFGLGHTVTVGIISAKGRSLGLGSYDDFLQTDAAINPGNSGGPLFNFDGELVGVNTAIIAGGQGIGFAIPVNMAKNVVAQLRTSGKVVRGWIGVYVQQVTPEIAESLELDNNHGALVADVTPGGPAEKAGIRRGDLIVEFAGTPIDEMPDLPRAVAVNSPGTRANLKVLRNGELKTLDVRLGELPGDGTEVATGSMNGEAENELGLVVQEITPRLQTAFGINSPEGVIITSVKSGSIAAGSGLAPGDVILEINKKQISSLEDYRDAVDSVPDGDNTLFLIQRGSKTLYVALAAER